MEEDELEEVGGASIQFLKGVLLAFGVNRHGY